jgi:hypothetical protein
MPTCREAHALNTRPEGDILSCVLVIQQERVMATQSRVIRFLLSPSTERAVAAMHLFFDSGGHQRRGIFLSAFASHGR